ncbi:F-box/WD repeat-containing protein [Acrasis kona]|uniref:F-box/WD repeat-containing protein n=1 Tax=Acrasis kona TaxID=1008807 RepID=A0AAW2ZP49_9EUKA
MKDIIQDLEFFRRQAREKYSVSVQNKEITDQKLNNTDVQPLFVVRPDGAEYIPNEVMIQITLYMDYKMLCTFGSVCGGWYFLSTKCNAPWRNLFSKEFRKKVESPSLFDDFDGLWRSKFMRSHIMRTNWMKAKVQSTSYYDFSPHEINTSTRTSKYSNDPAFRKDRYIVGQTPDESDDQHEEEQRFMINKSVLYQDKLITGDNGGNIKVFNTKTKQVIKKFKFDDSPVLDVQFNHINQQIYSTSLSHNTTITKWDMNTGLCSGMMSINEPVNEYPTTMVDSYNQRLFVKFIDKIKVYHADTFTFLFDIMAKKPQNQNDRMADDNDDDEDEDVVENNQEDDIDAQDFRSCCILVNKTNVRVATVSGYRIKPVILIWQVLANSAILIKKIRTSAHPGGLDKLRFDDVCHDVLYFGSLPVKYEICTGTKLSENRFSGNYQMNVSDCDGEKFVYFVRGAIFVCGVDGKKWGSFPLPSLKLGFNVCSITCDEENVIVRGSPHGLIVFNFGGNMTYWEDFKGGNVLK